jgi:hypothetical protein
MPNLDLSQPAADDRVTAPGMQPNVVPAEHSLSDLYTGGWRRRLSGLPSAVGRPLARWAGRGRRSVASAGRQHSRTEQDAAQT